MFLCLLCGVLLSTVGRYAWWREKQNVLTVLSQYDAVLSRFALSPEFIWQRLNGAMWFEGIQAYSYAALVWALFFLTSNLTSPAEWISRVSLLTCLDFGLALSSLQLSKVQFAHKVEKQVKGSWDGWLLIHGGVDYMKFILGGAEGNTIIALVHWFLDDKAAFCNGIRIGFQLLREGMDGAKLTICGCAV